jgi:hypothetical protein
LAASLLPKSFRSLFVTATTLPSEGSEASAFVVMFLPGRTRYPDGTVTPGPTRARAEMIAPGSMMAWSITAPGPIPVGLTDVP